MASKVGKGPVVDRRSSTGGEVNGGLPPLPEGYVWFINHDGEAEMQPTPTKAATILLQALEALEPWERYPENLAEWTPSQIRARGAPMPGYVLVTGRDANGSVFEHEAPVRHGERLMVEWRRRAGHANQGVVLRRSAIDERLERVRDLNLEILLPQAIRAVIEAGGRPEPLHELERDPELCIDTVGTAVVELRKVNDGCVAKPSTQGVDPMEDAVCKAIRKALWNGPLSRKVLFGRCGGAQKETTIKTRLRLLRDIGHVQKASRSAPYLLTEEGRAAPRT